MSVYKKQIVLCIGLLILAAIIAYEPMRHNGFIDYDDEDYVTKNPRVLQGLTKEGLVWSFTETDLTANWHPLTWHSHMLDVQLFGVNPLAHHAVSLLFHLVNTLLLFWIFARMTKAVWASFFIAAVFALHPLHVESVAWVAERKDVLSGLFWMLTMAAYVLYAEKPSFWRYLWVVVFLVLGLMAKPMLVTLPFVLLLLDYWPLERFGPGQQKPWKSFLKLIAEKIPLFGLSAACSVIVFRVQQHAGAMLRAESYSLAARISNSIVSYINYIIKSFWPVDLAVLYPHPGDSIPLWQPVAVLILLIAITGLVFFLGLKKRYLLTGWLWYVGTLVPVIGFVQVGSQAMADRYMYLPQTGLLIIVTWFVADVVIRYKLIPSAVPVVAIVLIAMLLGTRNQVSYWENTLTLYKHTLAVTKNNYVIHGNYGYTLQNRRNIDAAIEQFSMALQIKPDYVSVMNNYGMALRDQGKLNDAIVLLQKALKLEPGNPNANANLGLTLAMQGRNEQAIQCLNTTLQITPNFPGIHFILGELYFRMDRFDLSAEHFTQAIQEQPQNTEAINSLAVIYAQQGKMDKAIEKWKEILAIDPQNSLAYQNIGFAMAQKGQHQFAIQYYNIALQSEPDQPMLLGQLAVSYAAVNNYDAAIKAAQKAYNLAVNSGDTEMAGQMKKLLDSYKAQPEVNN